MRYFWKFREETGWLQARTDLDLDSRFDTEAEARQFMTALLASDKAPTMPEWWGPTSFEKEMQHAELWEVSDGKQS